jgi:ribosomal protein L19E
MATRKEIKAVMKQAAKYRKEGMSNHEALVKAWEGHKKSSKTEPHSGSRKGKRERRHHK